VIDADAARRYLYRMLVNSKITAGQRRRRELLQTRLGMTVAAGGRLRWCR
jgi:hypothetical protein